MPRVQRHEPSVSGWRTDEILVGVLQHAVGTALVLAACVLVYTDFNGRAAASALLSGLLVSALTRANQIRFRAVFEQGVALIGAWTVLAPWMLGFVAYDPGDLGPRNAWGRSHRVRGGLAQGREGAMSCTTAYPIIAIFLGGLATAVASFPAAAEPEEDHRLRGLDRVRRALQSVPRYRQGTAGRRARRTCLHDHCRHAFDYRGGAQRLSAKPSPMDAERQAGPCGDGCRDRLHSQSQERRDGQAVKRTRKRPARGEVPRC